MYFFILDISFVINENIYYDNKYYYLLQNEEIGNIQDIEDNHDLIAGLLSLMEHYPMNPKYTLDLVDFKYNEVTEEESKILQRYHPHPVSENDSQKILRYFRECLKIFPYYIKIENFFLNLND